MMRFLAILALVAVAASSAYEAPDDCDWNLYRRSGASEETSESEALVALTCHLSAINSNEEKTNFSVIPSDGTASLTVKCSPESGLISKLTPAAFKSLSQLEELILDGCSIDQLPRDVFAGLDNLRRLKINTVSSEKDGSGSLELQEGSLSGMPLLEELDLSSNRLRSLPPSELCNVPQLRLLNVSSNELSSLRVIGGGSDSEKCLLPLLEVLDVSGNEMTTLAARSLDFLPSLRELLVASNFIRHLESEALLGVSQLQVLDLSSNQISALSAPSVFRSLQKLSVLDLSDNALSSLETTVFEGLAALKVLDLSVNGLETLSKEHFKFFAASLEELILSENSLNSPAQDIFSELKSLRTLKLDHNDLGSVPSDLFSGLNALKELELSHNALSSFSASLPASLTHMHLSDNSLTEVSEGLLRNASSVVVLDLSKNQLRSVPAALGQLPVLQTLDMSHNSIVSLEGASILGLTSLWRLQLSHNQLENVTVGLFGRLSALQVLDLSSNAISSVERGSLDSNPLLQAVRLDANRLTTMDTLFHTLERLTWLNMSDNAVKEFDYAMLPRKLHWLDLSRNQITELGNYFDLTGEVALSVLDVSFNRLQGLGPNSIPDSIETLLVNDNAIETLVPYTFFKKNRLRKVDLTVNSLRSIDRNALRLSSDVSTVQPEFFLGGNPIECDCDMVWFKSINSGGESGLQNYPLVQDIESIYCRLVYTREVSFVPLVEARAEQFLCPYETHCFALCKCCDFDACDCEMSCPDNCTCYHDSSWSKNIAVCSAAEFNDLPDQLPMDATEIFLDGNNLSELGSHTFIGRKKLRSLHLNNSQIHTIQNKTFNGLKSLTVLHLEGNQLKELNGYEFETLTNLRELYLQNNLLESIHNATFKFLRSLEVLHLQGNRVMDFPVWQLAFNPFLVSVKLAENIWSCDCEYMERFRSWMSVYSAKIFDAEAITCISNEAVDANVRMVDFDVAQCAADGGQTASHISTTHVQELISEDYLPLLAATLASFAFVLLLLLCVFVYRHTLRVWIHSKYGVRVFDSSFSSEDDLVESAMGSLDRASESSIRSRKLFDLFVSYSPKDDVFVREVLATELETPQLVEGAATKRDYKTCLYHRDLSQGIHSQTYVADALVQATEVSRRSCIVLSENFLKSEWSRYDYKSGLHQALRSNGGGVDKKKKLIVILLGDVESREMDPDLRLYLKTSVVLTWGDKLFWEKLRYALPDMPLPTAQAHAYATLQQQHAHMKPVQPEQQLQLQPTQPQYVHNQQHHHQLMQHLRPSPVSSSASTSTNVSVVEDHYYQSPRYATYMPPPAPTPTQQMQAANNGLVFLNNNLQLATTNGGNNVNHYHSARPMPQLPGPQQGSNATQQQVVMHI